VKFILDLSPAQADQLCELAKSLGVDPHELAGAAVVDFLNGPDEDFQTLAEDLISKNTELYKRLS